MRTLRYIDGEGDEELRDGRACRLPLYQSVAGSGLWEEEAITPMGDNKRDRETETERQKDTQKGCKLWNEKD